MNIKLRQELVSCETDVEGALQRFCGNEELYLSYLVGFPTEPTMCALEEAVAKKDWQEAFTAAHALKGLAGNLGFIPLYHSTGELVVILRAGRLEEFDFLYTQMKQDYDILVKAIGRGVER